MISDELGVQPQHSIENWIRVKSVYVGGYCTVLEMDHSMCSGKNSLTKSSEFVVNDSSPGFAFIRVIETEASIP